MNGSFMYVFLYNLITLIIALMNQLTIGSFNVHGVNDTSLMYINKIMCDFDILLLQEHWLFNSQIHLLEDNIDHVNVYGKTGMDESKFLCGRPYGGCAIIWRDSLSCKITPITTTDKRLVAARLDFESDSLLLINVYMPCDTEYDQSNCEVFMDVLCEVSNVIVKEDVDFVIVGGDFNTDMTRSRSLHVNILQSFIEREFLTMVDNEMADYTYESLTNGCRSMIDHFLVSENLSSSVCDVSIKHDVDNISDHSILSLSVNLEKIDLMINVENEAKLLWSRASDEDIKCYKACLDEELSKIQLDQNAFNCTEPFCQDHNASLELFHNAIVKACLLASQGIPKAKPAGRQSDKYLPGWKQYVAPYRTDALFWHRLWKENGSPHTGIIAEIRRTTRSRYHAVLRKIKRNKYQMQAMNIVQSIETSRYNDFWKTINRLKGKPSKLPTTMDGVVGDDNIANLFQDKFNKLYTSVSYEETQMRTLKAQINLLISEHCPRQSHDSESYIGRSDHDVSVGDVTDAISKLKADKHDGSVGHYSDHIRNGTNSLHVYITLLFNSLLTHGYVPDGFLLSTIIPIPKNKLKCMNNSDNYRAIALSSILGKVMDKLILSKCSDVLHTLDMQFGFKKGHSTNHCTFVVNEVLQYYANNNSNTLVTLIDASKAFDRVNYVKLFKLLLSRKICPVYARFLLLMYTKHRCRVKWRSSLTASCEVKNGVKQGGVLSPILFNVYMDELLLRLKESGVGCYIGNIFCGALGYADDVTLLAPTLYSMKRMLDICKKFGDEFNVIFNPEKKPNIFSWTILKHGCNHKLLL